MPTPRWQPGTLYPTGSIVQPISAPSQTTTAIANQGFESGDSGWTKGANWTITTTQAFQGSWKAAFNGGSTWENLDSQTVAAVAPGTSITAQVMMDQGAASSGRAGGRVSLVWLDAADALVSVTQGAAVTSGSDGSYRALSVTGVAPPLAAKVHVRVEAFGDGSEEVRFDNVSWNYAVSTIPAGLVYKAVQPATGMSGSAEPAWPTTLGLTVVDNEVIWEAVLATRVVWEANPLFMTGLVEPVWPLDPGASIVDGSLRWEAVARRIIDENCPNNAATIILATHVFNVDGDIVRFCAAINPLDWTSEGDAGFLPIGLQGENANDARVLVSYRKNLGVMNPSSWQLWQADPDPEVMDILDAKPGVGSLYQRAAVNVGDDSFVLAADGIKNITQLAGNNSATAGAVGAPIDDLVRDALAQAIEAGVEPFGAYYPGLGQYLLAFPDTDPSGEYIPLVGEPEFTFDDDGDWTFDEGTLTYVSGAPGWTLQLPPGTLVRINVPAYQHSGDPDDLASFWTENDTVTNTDENPDFGFAPSPFEIVVGEDGLLHFDSPPETAPGTAIQFEVWLDETVSEGGTEVFVATKMKAGGWTWSRWLFPFLITEFSQYENDLYFRHGDHINRFDVGVMHDERTATDDPKYAQEPVEFEGWIQWNWMDCGAAGTTKQMQAFDLIATGSPAVSFGYDQRDPEAFTDAYEVDPDTVPGGAIQYEVMAPSLSPRVHFGTGDPWSLSSLLLYVDDLGVGL